MFKVKLVYLLELRVFSQLFLFLRWEENIIRFILFLSLALILNPLTVQAAVEGKTNKNISIYRYATSGSSIIGNISKGEEVTLISPKNNFYEIEYDGVQGWILRSSVDITVVDGYISSDDVRYRSSPHIIDDNIMGTLNSGTQVDIVAVVGDFCEIRYGDSLVYVSKEYVSSDKLHLIPKRSAPNLPQQRKEPDTIALPLETKNTNTTGKDIAFLAMDYVGGRYVWGGNDLNTGVDCSGFVRQIYKKFGISLSGASYTLVRYGKEVSKDELTYGDLVFFTSGGSGIGQIGIYISNDYFIHAASTKSGIIVSHFSDRKDFVTARRILN